MVHDAGITVVVDLEVVRSMLMKMTMTSKRTTLKKMMVKEKRTLLNMKWSIVIPATVMANVA